MKILVTGAAGFIGFHLCESLLDDGYEIFGVDNINNYYDQSLKHSRLQILKSKKNFHFDKVDISNQKAIRNLFEQYSPNKVVNLAAQAGVRYSLKNPYAYLESNLAGFINIIEMCRQFSVESLIYASSSSVYGGNKKIPYSIEDRVSKPLALYGATKRANELIAHSYSNLYDLNTTGLRYFTVYGPWYRPDMAMYVFIKKIIAKKSIEVFNNGKMKRDFTYIDDIIEGTKSAINRNYKYEIFNLGNSKSEKLMDMISIIEKSLGIKAIINFLPLQPGDVLETCADIHLSQKKLKYNPKTTIKEGIPKLVKWYKEYYHE